MTMWNDPLVEEIHKIREEHARKFKLDLNAIYNDWKQQEKDSDVRTVPAKVKRLHVQKADH